MKKVAKHLLLRFLIRPMQQLVGTFLRNVTNVPLLERLFLSVELLAVSLEDRIRQVKFSGRPVLEDGLHSRHISWRINRHGEIALLLRSRCRA